ncbi:ribosome maturation factor RimM [Kaarinaea lacus]
MDDPASQYVIVGKISSAYGIKGWINVYSFTDPVTNILNYQPWYLSPQKTSKSWEPVRVVAGRAHGKHVVAQIEGCNDRNKAELYRGLEIAVHRDQLPEPSANEYYWIDLVGLNVVNLAGVELGIVDSLLETGANDVLVVKGKKEHLIPYVKGEFIHDVDLENRRITVDWDPDF